MDIIEEKITQLKNNDWLDGFSLSKELNECINHCTSPNKKDIFNAFSNLTPGKTKVLIIGQDPYPEINKAHGYAFSVANHTIDDSLENIFKAVDKYKGIEYSPNNHPITDLSEWAQTNGVLLLNAALTYSNEEEYSKQERINAWSLFFKSIIKSLLTSNNEKLIVFLWGVSAQNTFFNALNNLNLIKKELFVLSTSHPSPQSVHDGFEKDAPKHFEMCDKFLGNTIWKSL